MDVEKIANTGGKWKEREKVAGGGTKSNGVEGQSQGEKRDLGRRAILSKEKEKRD